MQGTGQTAFFIAIALSFLPLSLFAQSELKRVYSDDIPLCIVAEEIGDSVEFWVENNSPGDITVTLDLELENMTCSNKYPYTLVCKTRSRAFAFYLKRLDRTRDWRYGSEYFAEFGNFKADHLYPQHYRLPFQSGKSFRVIQGYHGQFSHQDADSCGVDFTMPIGTAVCAAREGTVIHVVDSFEIGGAEEEYRDKVNLIIIQHLDGTIARYFHLEKDGAQVEPGQFVRREQVIGLSGHTGYSSGPHLHFDVSRPLNGETGETIPVKFDCREGSGIYLLEDSLYTAR